MRTIPHMTVLSELTSDDVLDTAYGWLCKGRRDSPADADVWSFRQAWAQEKDKLKAALAAGRFRFGLLTRITVKDARRSISGRRATPWCSRRLPSCWVAAGVTAHPPETRLSSQVG